jgi:hypothetical protein
MPWLGNLPDPDDYLYLTQALDALQGQSWFDAIQHRLNPPDGTVMHYSHLLSGFYALVIAAFNIFTDTRSAAILTAIILPPLFFAGFLFTIRGIGQKLIAPKWGDTTAWFVFFAPSLMSQFMPGHIDHHGLVVLITMIGFSFILRMILQPASVLAPIVAGALFALGLALGLELLPVAGLLTAVIAIWSMAKGGKAAESGLIYADSLFITSCLLLAATHGTDQFFDPGIVAYSIVYVILCGCFALGFLGVALAAHYKTSLPRRFAIGIALAIISGAVFLHAFPELKAGPYGGMEPDLARLIFAAAPEAWPLFRTGVPWTKTLMPLAPPLLALASALFLMLRDRRKDRSWLWGMLAALLTGTILLTGFYQQRFLYFAEAFAALPLAGMLHHDWTQVSPRTRKERLLRWTRIAVILLIGPVSMAIAGSYGDDFSEGADMFASSSTAGCDMHALAATLNDPQALGDHPRLILNTINEGSELLFRTPHSVLAGPYHTNLTGNLDALRFFTAPDAEAAKQIVDQRHADLIVICAMPQQLMTYKAAALSGQPIFLQQILSGELPDWLMPIASQDFGDLKLYAIKR